MDTLQRQQRAFSRRLNKALDDIGAPPLNKGRIDFLRRLYRHASGHKLSGESMRRWLNGNAIPHTSRLEDLAKALSVTAEYLLTGQEPAALRVAEIGPIDREEDELLAIFRRLSARERKLALNLVKQIAGESGS